MKTPSKPFGAWVTGLRSDIFTWARIKLSALYLLIIAVILLLFTVSIFASFKDRLNDHLHDANHHADTQNLSPSQNMVDDPGPVSAEDRSTYDRALDDIKQITIYADLAIFVIAGFLSYVLAGYTLRPIQEALGAQLAFSADASHELRTPLSVLRTNTELMLRDIQKSQLDDISRMLAVNLSEIESMSMMSNQLLMLARGQHETRATFKVIEFETIIRSVVQSLRPLAEQKGLSLRYAKMIPATVNGDEHALRRMVQNILANAINYTPSGATVTVSLHADSKQAELKITDTGIGIPQSDIPHIFERFYKADHARSDNNTGSGLGLAIVQQIVRAHGGTVRIESHDGTTVYVVLPCA